MWLLTRLEESELYAFRFCRLGIRCLLSLSFPLLRLGYYIDFGATDPAHNATVIAEWYLEPFGQRVKYDLTNAEEPSAS